MRPVAYYITAHGYGHGVRSCDIIRALHRLYPQLPVVVVSDLPGAFLRNRIGPGPTSYRSGSFDVGMVQLDSIRVDVDATLEKVVRLYNRRGELIEHERDFLREGAFAGIVADIPAIPFEAAAEARVPGVAISNFSWDWIYSEFLQRNPLWPRLIEEICRGYRCAELLLRFPFSDEMRVFRRIEDLPLVAAPGRERRAELARHAGARMDRKWVLLSFTTLDWGEAALRRVEALSEYEFFTVLPLRWDCGNIHAVDREVVSFADVTASVDAVVSKPGFGIVSDCVVNRRPLLYADRADFREYEVLVCSIRKHLRNAHIPSEELYAGNLGPWLKRLWEANSVPEPIEAGGDEVAARRIVDVLAP